MWGRRFVDDEDIEAAADRADADAYTSTRAADRVVVDVERIISYSKALDRLAKDVGRHRAAIDAADDWVLHNGMAPAIPGLIRTARRQLEDAQQTLAAAKKKTYGLAITYQAVDSRFPGVGVPDWLWEDTLNPRGKGSKKRGAEFYGDLDDMYDAAVKAADNRNVLQRGVNRAQQGKQVLDSIEMLRRVLRYQEAANEMVRAVSITTLNDALAEAGRKHPGKASAARTQLLMRWLNVSKRDAGEIRMAYERLGGFASIDDLILESSMPTATRYWLYDSVTGGSLAPKIRLRWGFISEKLRLGKMVDAANAAQATKAYAKMSEQMNREFIKTVRRRAGGLVPVAGAGLDAYAAADPNGSRLSRTSGSLGVAATTVEGAAVVAGGSIFGAPADVVLVPTAVVLEAASFVTGVADLAWNYRANQIKGAEYKKVFEVSYSHYTQRFLDERIIRLQIERQNKEECRTDVATSFRRPVEARAVER